MEFKDFKSSAHKQPWKSPYPLLQLSPHEKKQLRQLAHDMVQVNLEDYEEYLFDWKEVLPENNWKFLRRDQQCDTYIRRRDNYSLRGFGPTKRIRRVSETSSASGASQDELTSMDVVDVRTIGARDGSMEDAVYGAMAPTTETMRLKSVYVDDGIEDCNVVAIIDNVSPDDPFSSLTIRWRVTENPPVLRMLLKSYDHIYLEALGFVRLSTGERVGFHLLHSIAFAEAMPALSTYSRGQVAAFAFWRQKSDNVVEVHARGVFAVPFERARTIFAPVIAMSQAKTVTSVVYAAHMKKLRWAIESRRRRDTRAFSIGSSSSTNSMSASLQRQTSTMSMANGGDHRVGGAKHCNVCGKHRRIQRGDHCDLCGEYVCGSCRVTHKVAVVGLDDKMRWHKVRVCPFCMARVIKSDPAETIRGEIQAGVYDRFP